MSKSFYTQPLTISPYLQEFRLSAIEQRIIQETELDIMKITYREIVTEDGELMVTATPTEAIQPAFDTPIKNYRIMEGMSVTFHCKLSGMPLPKVLRISSASLHLLSVININIHRNILCSGRLRGLEMAIGSSLVIITRWRLFRMDGPVFACQLFCQRTKVYILPLLAM